MPPRVKQKQNTQKRGIESFIAHLCYKYKSSKNENLSSERWNLLPIQKEKLLAQILWIP